MEEFLRKPEIIRVTRDVPPAHYIFSIESFSLLVDTGVTKYESHAFDVENYKWRLSLYPNGNKKSNGEGFISLYLQIDGIENFPSTWEANVNFRFFIHDQIRDKYLTIEESDGVIKRYYKMKTGRLERVSMLKHPPNNTITFQLHNYSRSFSEYYTSNVQTIGDSKWELIVYPRGRGIWKNASLSVYLRSIEGYNNKLPSQGKVYAKYNFRVKDRYNYANTREYTGSHWFTNLACQSGFKYVMGLFTLQDRSKGYLVNDCLTVEAEIIVVSKVKLFL